MPVVSATGDEVEDGPHLAELFGEALHLLIAHARGVPVERGDRLYAKSTKVLRTRRQKEFTDDWERVY
jgi:hypothetical protein